MVNYICFDTETSGLDHTKYNLLTAHFIILNQDLEKIDSLDLKIKHPHYTVHPKALEINKIDIVSHTRDNQSLFISDANKLLVEFLNNNKQHYKFIPIGHNVNFDIQFIKSSGLLSELDYFKYISHIPLDTLTIAGFLKLSGYLPPTQLLNLVSLCKYLHINYPGPANNSAHGAANISAHNAEYDATMTVELLKVFKKFIDVDKTYLSSNKRKRED
jgi:DNA polymerase III alpha subunit (gram-positive type)